jgi:hypothetical protein
MDEIEISFVQMFNESMTTAVNPLPQSTARESAMPQGPTSLGWVLPINEHSLRI